MHDAEQPSPLTWPPSSHSSGASTRPFPQTAGAVFWLLLSFVPGLLSEQPTTATRQPRARYPSTGRLRDILSPTFSSRWAYCRTLDSELEHFHGGSRSDQLPGTTGQRLTGQGNVRATARTSSVRRRLVRSSFHPNCTNHPTRSFRSQSTRRCGRCEPKVH